MNMKSLKIEVDFKLQPNKVRCTRCIGTGLIKREMAFKCENCLDKPFKKCMKCENKNKTLWIECTRCFGSGSITPKTKSKPIPIKKNKKNIYEAHRKSI